MDAKGVKPTWLAQQISTTRRNMYDMLRRADLSTSVLAEISKKLEFNFFALYNDQLPNGWRNRCGVWQTETRKRIVTRTIGAKQQAD